METLQAGRSDPWYMLDNAETCLRFSPKRSRSRASRLGRTADHARTVVIEPLSRPSRRRAAPRSTSRPQCSIRRAPCVGPRRAAPAQPPQRAAKPLDREIDPELLELFIEEARRRSRSSASLFPLWEENPLEQEALVNVRRSFHTLKGSGRMVGAQLIGEFAWAIENLLNRMIDNTLDRTPDDDGAAARSSGRAAGADRAARERARAASRRRAHHRRARTAIAGVRPSAPRRSAEPRRRCVAARRPPRCCRRRPRCGRTPHRIQCREKKRRRLRTVTPSTPAPARAGSDGPRSARNLRQGNRGPSGDPA